MLLDKFVITKKHSELEKTQLNKLLKKTKGCLGGDLRHNGSA